MSLSAKHVRKRLQRAYDRIPEVHCQGKCQAYCGTITLLQIELDRIEQRAGPQPVIRMPVQFAHEIGVDPVHLDGTVIMGFGEVADTCPLLTTSGHCSQYDLRPIICRLWAAVEDLRCPHGCKPIKYLTRKEAYEIMAEVEKINKEAKG
jgi:Fe-S-cluster containining protein